MRVPTLSSTRRRVVLLAVGFVVIVAVVVTVGASVSRPSQAESVVHKQPQPSSRPARFIPCDEIVLHSLPARYETVERRLRALSDSHMGTVETFSHGDKVVKAFSGVDVIDLLEDLDLVSRPVRAGGKNYTLYRTDAAPTLLIAMLQDPRLEEPCDVVAVETVNLGVGETMTVLAGLEVRGRNETWGATNRWADEVD